MLELLWFKSVGSLYRDRPGPEQAATLPPPSYCLPSHGPGPVRRSLGSADQNRRRDCTWRDDYCGREGHSLDCARPWVHVAYCSRSAATLRLAENSTCV